MNGNHHHHHLSRLLSHLLLLLSFGLLSSALAGVHSTVVSGPVPQAALVPLPTLAQWTNQGLYAQTVAWGSWENYQTAKNNPQYADLDWSLDGCSAPPGLGFGYRDIFQPACDMHDFAYRNLPKLLGTEQWLSAKQRTDQLFLKQMNALCDARLPLDDELDCWTVANMYYLAVRDMAGWVVWVYHGNGQILGAQ